MAEACAGVQVAPDETLVQRACRGDSAAREELFRRHFDVAYRVAYRLLGQEQDALDAVQDGFLKGVTHLHEFDGRSTFRTWLLRIVTNASLDSGRKRRRRPTIPLGDSRTDGIEPEVTEDPGLGLHRADLRRRIDQALARLSPETRQTFVLFAEAEFSYKEIAECQGLPIGTVMSRLHYARQKLQSFLEGIDEPA
ncbi:MAG: RNA polymerase sigma factor [Isosphaeraceae bacterium]